MVRKTVYSFHVGLFILERKDVPLFALREVMVYTYM